MHNTTVLETFVKLITTNGKQTCQISLLYPISTNQKELLKWNAKNLHRNLCVDFKGGFKMFMLAESVPTWIIAVTMNWPSFVVKIKQRSFSNLSLNIIHLSALHPHAPSQLQFPFLCNMTDVICKVCTGKMQMVRKKLKYWKKRKTWQNSNYNIDTMVHQC